MKMKKEQVLARMKEDCLVAVVRAKNYEQGEKVVDAIIAGGINFIELTMTMDDGDPVGFIKLMAEKYKGNDKIVYLNSNRCHMICQQQNR
jgi:2-dehydro-3-deoxyphosphogluconate aldolase / (4S)-4-hydroxy-2-oxoglutarate aldolase